jgi:hypothetical protein
VVLTKGKGILIGKVTNDTGRVILHKKTVDNAGRETPKELVAGVEIFNISQYVWEHGFQWPNGFPFPLTCPFCHYVTSWQNILSCSAGNGSAFNVVCKMKVGNG